MHSGADVEALTAALNRDIKGGVVTSQPAHSGFTKIFTLYILQSI